MQIGKKSIRLNPRLWIRMNPKSELFKLIRIENSVWIILTSDSFGLEVSDWILVKIKNLGLRRIDF